MLNNFIGSLLGSAINYGINAMTNPTFKFNSQISQMQKQINEQLSSQMAMLSQGTLGSGTASNGIGGMTQIASYMPMMTGLNSFYGNINTPAISGANTAAPAAAVDINSQEVSASMSAKEQDRDKLIEGLIDFNIGNADIKEKTPMSSSKTEAVNKLKEDLKNVPTEAIELLNKNGTKIKILDKGKSLSDAGLIPTVSQEEAVAKQNSIVDALNAAKDTYGFKDMDPSVIKRNYPGGIMTYIPTGKNGPSDIKGIDLFEGQVVDQLAKVYYEGKTPTEQEISDFKNTMYKTNDNEADLKGFTDAWKKNRADAVASGNTAKLARIDKILGLEDMLAAAKEAPIREGDKYYAPKDYKIIKEWANGNVESLYCKNDKTVYLKEEVLGKMMSEKDPGKVSVHELGHAIKDALQSVAPNFGKKMSDKVKQNYDADTKADDDPYNLNAQGKNEFISAYSSTSADEYFAETLSAYFYPDKAKVLKQNDPTQYNTIEAIMKVLNNAKNIAMGQTPQYA